LLTTFSTPFEWIN